MIRGSHGYDSALDEKRLISLRDRVRNLLLDGKQRSLGDIVAAVGGSEAGVSARIRELRTDFKYDIQKRRVGDSGLWVYWMVMPDVDKRELFS